MVYPILSTHLDLGKHSVSSRTKIDAKEIVSGKGLPPTVGSYKHFEGKGPLIYRKPNGETVARHITSNNKWETSLYDFLSNGDFSPQVDGGIRRGSYQFPTIDSWREAGENNYSSRHNRIPKMPNIEYITGITPLGLYLPNERDTQVNLRVTPRIVEAVDPNKLGYFEHKKGNLQEDELRSNLLFDFANRFHYDIVEAMVYLDKKGLDIKTETPIFGLGIETPFDKEFVAKYYPESGYLVVPPNFHEIAKAYMARYGLTEREAIEAMKRSFLIHELKHAVYGVPGDRKGERFQGLSDAEFYTMLAENFKGTKWERIHRALAEEGRDYAREYSLSKTVLREITKNPFPKMLGPLELLIAKFAKEAEELGEILKSRGISKEEYIERRLKETYGQPSEEPSYRELKIKSLRKFSQSKEQSSGKEKLDDIVEEEGVIPISRKLNANKAQKYEGEAKKTYEDGKSSTNEKENAEGDKENAVEADGEAVAKAA